MIASHVVSLDSEILTPQEFPSLAIPLASDSPPARGYGGGPFTPRMRRTRSSTEEGSATCAAVCHLLLLASDWLPRRVLVGVGNGRGGLQFAFLRSVAAQASGEASLRTM